MEKKINSTSSRTTRSSSSICSRIRQALSSYPAFRAIHRINQYNYYNNKPESSNSSSSPNTKHTAKNSASIFQSNPPLPQYVKVMKSEGRGGGGGGGESIPINFDYSTTTNPSLSSISKVSSPHQQQGGFKKSLDINDTFAEFIQRTKNNIRRSASNLGRTQGNSASATISDHEANNYNTSGINMGNQKDPFSDYIQRAGKRLRTTSNVAKPAASIKRG